MVPIGRRMVSILAFHFTVESQFRVSNLDLSGVVRPNAALWSAPLFVRRAAVRICLSCAPPSSRRRAAMHGPADVRRCGPDATVPSARRRRGTSASARCLSRASGSATCDDCANGLSPSRVGPACGLLRMSGRVSAGQALLRRGALWRGQWRWPAEASLHRACPRGCGASLRARTRPPELMAICLPFCRVLHVPLSLFPACWPPFRSIGRYTIRP
jgi:hypothetical protein